MKKKITEILLQNFRNHDFCKFSINSDFVLFFGCNGIGKTSILEAISKLSPGSGLRSATNTEIARQRTNPWQIHFKFSDSTYVGSGFDFQNKEFTQTRLGINRDLHCWQMSVNWIPFGRFQSYNVDIRVKSSILQDLKLSRRRSFVDSGASFN